MFDPGVLPSYGGAATVLPTPHRHKYANTNTRCITLKLAQLFCKRQHMIIAAVGSDRLAAMPVLLIQVVWQLLWQYFVLFTWYGGGNDGNVALVCTFVQLHVRSLARPQHSINTDWQNINGLLSYLGEQV